jgi:hypothetical protein
MNKSGWESASTKGYDSKCRVFMLVAMARLWGRLAMIDTKTSRCFSQLVILLLVSCRGKVAHLSNFTIVLLDVVTVVTTVQSNSKILIH